jgi:hypothetical protein
MPITPPLTHGSCTDIYSPRLTRLADSRPGSSPRWATQPTAGRNSRLIFGRSISHRTLKLSEVLEAGQLFTIRAILEGRNGDSAVALSVWFVPAADGPPRFVTAYPGGNS